VRRGSNLPRILEQLRKERPMSLREVAIIFAHLEYSGLTMQEMLRTPHSRLKPDRGTGRAGPNQ